MATPDPTTDAYAVIRAELDAAAGEDEPSAALPHLRVAAERLAHLLDDTMATALLVERASLRAVGAGAGLSENAVGPRLARTRLLAAYANEAGRVTASGVERARYDHENGQVRTPAQPPEPMRFKPRRTT